MLVMRSVPAATVASPLTHDALRPLLPSSISTDALTNFLEQARLSRSVADRSRPLLTPFEIGARVNGQLIFNQWLEGQPPYRAMQDVLSNEPAVDLLHLAIVTGRVELSPHDWRSALSAEKNGRCGLEISLNGILDRVSPLETIATNRPLLRWFEKRLEQKNLSASDFFKLRGKIALLHCNQFVLPRREGAAIKTFRGSQVVNAEVSAGDLADQIISGIARWFMANQDQEGSIPYKYWPSAGIYSQADNPIRRFMASVVLNRLAESLDRQDIRTAARKSLGFNLKRFYSIVDGEGAILWNESVKLGAMAIAAQAIIESPFGSQWQDQLAALRRTIDKLWESSGAFRTFFLPKDRNDNQNFYPGEALLFWATSLAQQPDDALMARTLRSLSYYRNHFRKRPNPAFVPWHTQAATIILRLTGDQQWRDYIFEMNDWLLPHQQWGDDVEPDHCGRFYSPSKPEYGPPHASSTGVFLEGLVDAWSLAREAGDEIRARQYLQAIERGIRSIAQLQFTGASDTYYISRKQRVMGAIRTESDNNEIRIDNMQHALAALLKFKSASQLRAVQ